MANRLERELSEILTALLAESRIEAVHEVSWNACRFISALRTIRDREEGGDE
jgi:hypothetical protein